MNTVIITNTKCPSCGEKISFGGRPVLHHLVICSNCEEELEVVRLNPVKLSMQYYEDDGDDLWEDDY